MKTQFSLIREVKINYLTFIYLFLLLTFFSCKKDDGCPRTAELDFIELYPEYVKINPYTGEEKIIFINDEKEELIFELETNRAENRQVQSKYKCSENSMDSIEVNVGFALREIKYFAANNFCISVQIKPLFIYGYCYDINSDNQASYFHVLDIGLTTRTNAATRGIYLDTSPTNSIGGSFSFGDTSFNSNGKTYKNVLEIIYPNEFFENIFNNIYIAENIGIIQFDDADQQTWYLK